MRVLVSLLLIVLLVDTWARAPMAAEVRPAGRRGARDQQAITNKRARTSVCERAFRCSGLVNGTDPDVRVTPISYALSNHHNVHEKLASYGHVWSTIDIFFKCVVSRRLQQLRDAPKSMPSLPMQHVIIPQSLKAKGGGGRLGTNAFEFLQTIFSGPAVQLQVHRANWVPICFAQHGSGCCTSNASVAVPQAVAVAAILLRGDADDLSGLLQGEKPPRLVLILLPGLSRTLYCITSIVMSILGTCVYSAPPILHYSVRAASARHHRGRPRLG